MYGEQGTVAPELANMRHPERVLEIHKEYVKAGAGLIRTNTFAANTASLDADTDYVISNVRAAVKLAKQAADGEAGTDHKKVYIAGDIGPIPADAGLTLNERVSQYKLLGEYKLPNDLLLNNPSRKMLRRHGEPYFHNCPPSAFFPSVRCLHPCLRRQNAQMD